jgi:catechol-2,3-dioxygenase
MRWLNGIDDGATTRSSGATKRESIHHVALVVNDSDAALAFYRDVLGLPVVDRPDGANNPGSWLST